MEMMDKTLAAHVLKIASDDQDLTRKIMELNLPRDIRNAVLVGSEVVRNRKIANLVIDAGLVGEPVIDPALLQLPNLPQSAIQGMWDEAINEIAQLGWNAAMVAVVAPLMPSDPDL